MNTQTVTQVPAQPSPISPAHTPLRGRNTRREWDSNLLRARRITGKTYRPQRMRAAWFRRLRTTARGRARKGHDRRSDHLERREWDSNPRDRLPGPTVFKTVAFVRSTIPPTTRVPQSPLRLGVPGPPGSYGLRTTSERFAFGSAEGVGFEPTGPETRSNGFRDRHIRPLCHPSRAGQAGDTRYGVLSRSESKVSGSSGVYRCRAALDLSPSGEELSE